MYFEGGLTAPGDRIGNVSHEIRRRADGSIDVFISALEIQTRKWSGREYQQAAPPGTFKIDVPGPAVTSLGQIHLHILK